VARTLLSLQVLTRGTCGAFVVVSPTAARAAAVAAPPAAGEVGAPLFWLQNAMTSEVPAMVNAASFRLILRDIKPPSRQTCRRPHCDMQGGFPFCSRRGHRQRSNCNAVNFRCK